MMMKKTLETLIEQSLNSLYTNDKDLLERRVSERDLSHRFAHYLKFTCKELI